MSQTWTSDVYALDHEGDTDLGNMENMFNTLRTMFSGAVTPAFVGGGLDVGLPWFDTGAGGGNNEKVFKIYDGSSWRGIIHGRVGSGNTDSVRMRIYVYSNTPLDGWNIYDVSDRVLALRGGNYGGSGGVEVGDWTQPTHALTIPELPVHHHHYTRYSSLVPTGGPFGGGWMSAETHDTGDTGSGNLHNHGDSYRPFAAVGTLQYLED